MVVETARHDPYAPLRLSSYRRYLAGLIVLIVGQQMQKVAVGWEIYERTGSALNLGFVGLVQFLPLVLLAIPAGHITDSYNRKHILIASLSVTALAGVGLAWNSAHHGSVLTMYLLLLLTGSAKAFQNPARAAIVPRLVPREIFSTAASWNSSGFELASMTGPAIGGLVIGFTRNAVWVYLLNAASAVGFIIALVGVPYVHQLV